MEDDNFSNNNYGDKFIIKRHFDEFANKICHAIALQSQYPNSGLSKQATIQALHEKHAVQQQDALKVNKLLNSAITKLKA